MAIHSSLRVISLTLMLAFGAVACSGGKAKTPPTQTFSEVSVEELYNVAVDDLESKSYATASTKFDEVERQHPYSTWAVKAQIMAAYSLYMANQYDEAVVALDRYIQLHPGNKDVDYAYYLKGLCYYEQISDVGRDQLMTQLALSTLKELKTRFPKSNYARDASLKIDLTYDHLAGKEMKVGRYYQSSGQWLASITRFSVVIKKFETTTHVPEALHRMVESYLALGMQGEARKTAAVLGHNFKSSPWYLETYAILDDPTIKEEADNPWYKLW
ncbi:MAG: outer membrane protein assembly factor BamD [Rhodospirillaceae bacterium]|nr:MAG: outer membrane protein assembly factor BamD [Rhodospirillaceae bacterium]